MKLFLSGGGGAEDSIKLDKKFAKAIGNSKPLLYIPIAIDPVRHPFPDCYKWICSTFNPLGIDKIEMWLQKDLRERSGEELRRFSGVYIGGGNTFYLLKELRESGFISKLQKLIKNNVPVYGGSAGAIICFKTIIPALAADPNDVGLTDFNALNLVYDYDLWCHYVPTMDVQIAEYKNKYKLEKIVTLPENAGLCVTESGIEEVGPGKVKYL
jgi:dipeptidase E